MKHMDPFAIQTNTTDVLNIAGELIPELGPELDQLLERGKSTRVKILEPAEHPDNVAKPHFALTKVSIQFKDEENLRKCVRLLRWSDARLRARPEQLILWDWQASFREGMSILFGVGWYDRDFFERRKDAFLEPAHSNYYALFGAKPEDFRLEHVIGPKDK